MQGSSLIMWSEANLAISRESYALSPRVCLRHRLLHERAEPWSHWCSGCTTGGDHSPKTCSPRTTLNAPPMDSAPMFSGFSLIQMPTASMSLSYSGLMPPS